MRSHLPNIITLSNLFCGTLAIFSTLQGLWPLTALLIGLALLADFLDGFVARQLGVASPLGQELDSLADMVSFGVVPGLVLTRLAGLDLLALAPAQAWAPAPTQGAALLAALLIPIFSAVRLAKFNLDTRQSTQFIGVPTPTNTLLIVSLWVIVERAPDHWLSQFLRQPWALLVLTALLCYLLVAELPLLALKFRDVSLRHNWARYLLLAGSLVLLLLLQEMAFPLIFVLYLLLSFLVLRLGTQS